MINTVEKIAERVRLDPTLSAVISRSATLQVTNYNYNHVYHYCSYKESGTHSHYVHILSPLLSELTVLNYRGTFAPITHHNTIVKLNKSYVNNFEEVN